MSISTGVTGLEFHSVHLDTVSYKPLYAFLGIGTVLDTFRGSLIGFRVTDLCR